MIILDRVSKAIGKGSAHKVVLSHVTAALPTNRHIAVLATSKAERAMFLQLLARTVRPDAGNIYHDAHVSFPVGQLSGFVPGLSSRTNIAYLARLYGRNVSGSIRRVEKYSGFGKQLDVPFGKLNRVQRNILTNVVAFSIPFDFYVLPRFPIIVEKKNEIAKLFARRMRKAGMIVPVKERLAQKYCDMVVIVAAGRLFSFENIQEGFSAFREVTRELRAM